MTDGLSHTCHLVSSSGRCGSRPLCTVCLRQRPVTRAVEMGHTWYTFDRYTQRFRIDQNLPSTDQPDVAPMSIHVNTGARTYGTDVDTRTHTWLRTSAHGYTDTGAYMQIPRCEGCRTQRKRRASQTRQHRNACIVCGWKSALLAGIYICTGRVTVSRVCVHRHGLDPVLHSSHLCQHPFIPTVSL